MLSGDARYAVGRLASAVVTMTGAAYVREQLLSDPEVLSGALDGIRVRIQARKIGGDRSDFTRVAEGRMLSD